MTDKPSENLKTIWKNLAKKIIACLLVDEGAIFPVMEIIQDNERWFPDKERLIWRAILECVEEMVIPTVESVAAKLGAAVPLAYLQAIAGLFNDNDNRQLIYHVEQLREVGVLVSIKRLGKELVSADSTDDIDHLTNRVTLELSGLLANRVERHPDTNSIDRTTWAEVEAFSGMSIPTGLQWFDDHAGGLWPGMNYWVVAAYKSGKCVVGDTLVLTPEGLRKIRDLVGVAPYGFTPTKLKVMGPKGWVETSHVYREPPMETIKIETARGYNLEGTPDHPVRVIDESGCLAWKDLRDIRIGDYVTVKTEGLPDSFTGPLLPLPKRYPKCRAIPQDLPIEMDSELATLTGLLVAEGTMNDPSRVMFATENPELEEFFKRIVGGYGLNVVNHRPNFHVNSKVFRQWLNDIGFGFWDSSNKEIPWSILQSNKECQAAFIGGYFCGDGSVYKSSPTAATSEIEMVTKSEVLAKQVQVLLCRLGVLSKVTPRIVGSYGQFFRIMITGVYVDKFYEVIPVIHLRKKERLEGSYLLPGKHSARRDIDIIPHQATRLAEIHKVNRTPIVKNLVDGRKLGASRGGLPLASLTVTRAKRLVDVATGEEVDYLTELTGYSYCKVVSIKSGFAETYDFTIPDGHAFWSNGLISHNSTIMRNCILTAAQAGFPTAAYCAEGSREMFELDCLAMLAAGNVLSREAHLKDQLRFSGLWIKRAWNKRDRFMKRWEVEAIECARQVWRTLPIRVYDSRDGIKDLTTLHYLIKRDKLKFGVQSVWLDYSQLFGKGETIYDRQSTTAQKIQDIASGEMVAIAALAQKNEEGVRAKGDSASPAVKGGGDAAAAADFLLIPEIDRDTGNYMELRLKFSRHVAPRDGQHVIDPPSGLVLDRWFRAATSALN